MGMTQTKLHHRVLQENWPAICRRLQTEDGKRWVRTRNPCGDYPLHLACYGGHAPPVIIRALLAAYPEALHLENNFGFKPIQLAQSNYREGHPFREEVLEYLGAYSAASEGEGDQPNEPTALEANPAQPEIVDMGPETANLLSGSTFVSSTTCVVCLERPADHVVVPCGHLCLCGDCARKVVAKATASSTTEAHGAQGLCPVGRCAFTAIARVVPSSSSSSNTKPMGSAGVVPNQCIVVS